MKIAVLAGGLSTERNISLISGTEVCKALRRRGHQAAIVDLFMGFEKVDAAPETAFDAPDGLLGTVTVTREEPDLEAIRKSRADQSRSIFGPGVLDFCRALGQAMGAEETEKEEAAQDAKAGPIEQTE